MQELTYAPGRATFGLSGCHLLDGLPASVAQGLEAVSRWYEFAPGEVVLDAGAKLYDVYFIAAGVIRIFHRLHGRREVTFAEFRAGGVFGELSAIDGGGRTADAIAVTPCVVALCPQAAFLQAMAEHPTLALAVMRKLTGIIRQSDQRIADLAAMTPSQRIYAELLRLAVPDPDQPSLHIITPAPLHKDIAAWAGTEQDVVGRALGHLMKTGLLVRRGSALIVTDRERVDAMARTVEAA